MSYFVSHMQKQIFYDLFSLNNTVKEKKLFLEFQGGNLAVFDYFFDKYYQGLLCICLSDAKIKL